MNELIRNTSNQLIIVGFQTGKILLNENDLFIISSKVKSPIYFDLYGSLQHPVIRQLINRGFLQVMVDIGFDFDFIIGTSNDDFYGYGLAEILACPFIGRNEDIVNLKNRKVLVVTGVFTDGIKESKTINAVVNAGGDCPYVLSIFNYELPGIPETFWESPDHKIDKQLVNPCRHISLIKGSNVSVVIKELNS